MIPTYSEYPDTAQEFLLHLVGNYAAACEQSKFYNFPAWSSTTPELFEEGGWLDSDPFGSEPPDKLLAIRNAEEWTVNLGWPGPANAAIGEIFATFVLPNMMAKAARGEMTAQEAVAEAEALVVPIFDKWRAEGLIGGGQ